MNQRTPIRLKGIVIAAAWRPDGTVDAVDIAGCDEKRYRVADSPIGRRLLKCSRARVFISGAIDRTTEPWTLYVDRFRFDDVDAELDGSVAEC
jgi:hypothetical protein